MSQAIHVCLPRSTQPATTYSTSPSAAPTSPTAAKKSPSPNSTSTCSAETQRTSPGTAQPRSARAPLPDIVPLTAERDRHFAVGCGAHALASLRAEHDFRRHFRIVVVPGARRGELAVVGRAYVVKRFGFGRAFAERDVDGVIVYLARRGRRDRVVAGESAAPDVVQSREKLLGHVAGGRDHRSAIGTAGFGYGVQRSELLADADHEDGDGRVAFERVFGER